jgi:type I restriction enzyme S subunit
MSKLEELIQELCPDGVEYKKIGETCLPVRTISWGTSPHQTYKYIDLTSVDRVTHSIGDTQYINRENAPSRAQQVVKENDVIFGTTRPTLKRYCYISKDFDNQICSTGFCVIRANSAIILPRYIYHIISTVGFQNYVELNQKGSAYPSISNSDVLSYVIPLPPLPVQEEIVRILDKFTALEAELEAELEARKKQYEFFQNILLTPSEDSKVKKLKDIFIMRAGKNISSTEISEIFSNEFSIPCFGGNGLRGFVKSKSHSGSYVIIGRQGALCGNVKRVSGDFYATEHAVVVTASSDVNIDWAFYILSSMNLNQYATKSAQPGLAVGTLEELEILLPSLEAQAHIVSILDRFDTLVNDITQGLPAELAARRRQYEYYRDKLLTFKEKVS